MKALFLDIDGVLNSNFWNETHQMEISDGILVDKEKHQVKTDSSVGLTKENVIQAIDMLLN